MDAAKKFPALILKGGYMEGKVLSADEAKGLADLDSKEVMLSKIAGLLKGEMSRAASMFVSAQSKFLSLLEAYKEKVPDDSVAEAASRQRTKPRRAAAEAAERRRSSGRRPRPALPRPRPPKRHRGSDRTTPPIDSDSRRRNQTQKRPDDEKERSNRWRR